MTPDELAAWVERSCAAQGVPVRVSDPATVDQVVTLLRGRTPERSRAQRGSTAGPRGSDAPHGADAVGVEPAPGDCDGVDDGVVEDGFDDGGLAGEVER